MKKFNFSKLAAALAASAMILTAAFTGCSSSSSGGGGGDDEDGKIESVSITPSTTDSVESGSPVTLTATVTGDISDDNVTYAWKVTENADYGTLSATDGKEVTLTLTNEDENAHIVKVTLTATNKNDVENTAADNAYVTVKGKDGSTELPEGEKTLEEEKEEEEKKEAEAGKTGTVSIKVAVDDSENPTYTVIFNDTAEEGYTAQESVKKTVEYGDTVAAPEWTRDGYSLTWTSSVDGVTVNSDITADVTFTTVWTEKPKCSNCGTHYDTQAEADACSVKEGCPNYGKVTTITFVAGSGKGSATASSDNSGITVNVTGGNTSSDTLTYNSKTYSPLLKIESSTKIVISGAAGKKVTVVMATAGKKIAYDTTTDSKGKEKAVTASGDTNGVATFTAPTGESFTISKGDSVNVGVIFIE